MSPRFLHFKFLSDERAPIASCHLIAILVLVFFTLFFDWMRGIESSQSAWNLKELRHG